MMTKVLVASRKFEGKSLGSALPQVPRKIGILLTQLTGLTIKVEERCLGF